MARSNKVTTMQFERAKKIVTNDCAIQDIVADMINHNKLSSYDPIAIESCDIAFFITANNLRAIGSGLASQCGQCRDNNIPAYHLDIKDTGSPLSNREYRKIQSIKVKNPAAYDEKHAIINREQKLIVEHVYGKITTKSKKKYNEVDEIDVDDIQAAADMYDEIVSKESLYINSLKTNKENGKTIEVSRSTPSIRRGEERGGRTVHSRGSQATVRVGHLSNKEISGFSSEGQEEEYPEEDF